MVIFVNSQLYVLIHTHETLTPAWPPLDNLNFYSWYSSHSQCFDQVIDD